MTGNARERELMLLHDGELPALDAARLEQELADEPGALAELDDLERIGDAIRGLADARGAAGDSIADAVMARIEQERAAPAGWPAWRRIAPAGAALLAMAAAAVLVLHARAPYPGPAARVVPSLSPAHQPVSAGVATQVVAEPAVPAPEGDDGPPSVAIESVDFGSRDGTIFMVQSGQTETPVVWLVDEPASPGARIEPL